VVVGGDTASAEAGPLYEYVGSRPAGCRGGGGGEEDPVLSFDDGLLTVNVDAAVQTACGRVNGVYVGMPVITGLAEDYTLSNEATSGGPINGSDPAAGAYGSITIDVTSGGYSVGGSGSVCIPGGEACGGGGVSKNLGYSHVEVHISISIVGERIGIKSFWLGY